MVTPVTQLREIQTTASEAGLPVHLDGARLWNASAATGTSLAEFAACAETVMVSFSKGLGAPAGAALVGSEAAMEHSRETRKRLGGGMRQSGILAAAALHGLDVHLPLLGEDHRRTKMLAAALAGAKSATVVPPDTNILMLDLTGISASDVAARAKAGGVLVTSWSPTRIRCVLHLDVDDAACARAATVLAEILG
jgi:threonine aldolase